MWRRPREHWSLTNDSLRSEVRGPEWLSWRLRNWGVTAWRPTLLNLLALCICRMRLSNDVNIKEKHDNDNGLKVRKAQLSYKGKKNKVISMWPTKRSSRGACSIRNCNNRRSRFMQPRRALVRIDGLTKAVKSYLVREPQKMRYGAEWHVINSQF